MLKLVVYPALFGEPSASPFCVKAMGLLKLAGLSYSIEATDDPRKAPKAKLPVLQDSGAVIADSDQIRDHIEKTLGLDFDEGLDPAQQAVSRAVIRMMEEHLYFAIVCDRWINDDNWAHVKRTFFTGIPVPLKGLVTNYVRKQARAQLHGQGMGRHNKDERFERVRKDISAIVTLLGEKPFLFGDKPSAADISVVAMLRAAMVAPVATDLSSFIAGNATLTRYLDRGREAIYP